MKRCIIVVLLALGFLFSQSIAFAGGGKAFIPFYNSYSQSSSNYEWTGISLSNISSNSIRIRVKLYRVDSSIETDDGSSTSGNIFITQGAVSGYNDALSDTTVELYLDPLKTVRFIIHTQANGVEKSGYGIVEWSANNQDGPSLLAHAFHATTGAGRATIPINQGLPF